MSSTLIITTLLNYRARQEAPFFSLKHSSAFSFVCFWHISWYLHSSCNYFEGLKNQKHCQSKIWGGFKACRKSLECDPLQGKFLAQRRALAAHRSWLRSWFIQPKSLPPSVRASSWQLSRAHVTPPGEDLSPPLEQHHARAWCLDSTALKPSVDLP